MNVANVALIIYHKTEKKIYSMSIVCHFRFEWDVKSNFFPFRREYIKNKAHISPHFFFCFFVIIHSHRPLFIYSRFKSEQSSDAAVVVRREQKQCKFQIYLFSLDSPRFFGWVKWDIFLVISCRCLQKTRELM